MSDTPISEEEAVELARRAIAALSQEHDLVLLRGETLERPFGWVFFYTTSEYVRTGDPNALVPGCGPLVVHRADGSRAYLSTSVPPEVAVAIYEERWRAETEKKEPL